MYNVTIPSNVYGMSTQAVNVRHEASNLGSKSGLSQAEQVKRYLRKAEAQVYIITYTRTVLSKFASDAMSNTLRKHNHRYQSPLFELPY